MQSPDQPDASPYQPGPAPYQPDPAPPAINSGPPYPNVPQTTNGFAIASLVTGLSCIPLVGGVFSIIALRQIRREGQAGKGMAVAGLVLSVVALLVVAGVFVAALLSDPERDADGVVVESGKVSVDALQVGDCTNDAQEEGVATKISVVPCAEPHDGEVYASFDVKHAKWPGDDAIWATAEKGCADRLLEVSQEAYDDESVEIFYFTPTSATWREDDRKVVCTAQFRDGPRTGPLVGK